jgi:hypothetical protein
VKRGASSARAMAVIGAMASHPSDRRKLPLLTGERDN